jgi:hypothetical protein
MSRINQTKIQQRVPAYVPNLHVNPDAPIQLSVCLCMLDKLDTAQMQSYFKKSFVVYVGEGKIDNPNSISLTPSSNKRNTYLSFVVANKQHFDLMIVLDDASAYLSSFSCCSPNRLETWDAVFANQSYKYYDIDSLSPKANLPKRELQKYIPSNTPPIPVISAFGGLALYKVRFLSENMYGPEGHVVFNTRFGGQRKFIDPSLLLVTSPEKAKLYV